MNIIHNTVYVNQTSRGTCNQLGVSLKTGAIKYLFCTANEREEFAVSTNALVSVSDFRLELSALRTVVPKNAVKLFIGQPVYTHNGVFLGSLKNIVQENMRVNALRTEKNVIPFSAVQACADAIILRKSLPYPLGQTIPTSSPKCITRPVLKNAIKEKSLIRLTLSLSPFHVF